MRSDRGPMSARPANIDREIPASVPPAMTTSASPPMMRRRASSSAAVPLAQASAEALTGPCTPRSIATSHAAMLRMVEGTKYGLRSRGPRSTSARTLRSISGPPATAALMTTPMSSAPGAVSSPASATASRAAAMASWLNRAERRKRLGPSSASPSKPWISPAIRTGRSDASKLSMAVMPERPSSSACQVSGAVLPTGVMAPIPVTTGSRR